METSSSDKQRARNNDIHSKDIHSHGEERQLLTVEQAAQYLQLSASSIRSYIRQGKLKAFRVAGLRKVLIARAELLTLLEPTHSDKPQNLPVQNPAPARTRETAAPPAGLSPEGLSAVEDDVV